MSRLRRKMYGRILAAVLSVTLVMSNMSTVTATEVTESMTEVTTEVATEATAEIVTEGSTDVESSVSAETGEVSTTEASTEATTVEPTTEAASEAATEVTTEQTTEAITVIADEPVALAAEAVVEGDITVSTADEFLEALQNIQPGYAIKIKAGTYNFSKMIVIEESNSGTAGAMKKVVADGGDVTFDFSAMGYTGSDADKSNRGIVLDGSYWHFYGIRIKEAADNGMLLSGDNNIIEMCVFESNHDTGLQLSRYQTSYDEISEWPSNNLIKNCTSFNNVDIEGENADGFAPKLTCGEGNVFDGCMAYNNSDDGWDCYAKTATGPIGVITLKNCIAFRNGKLTNGQGSAQGDMNGFKLGGSGVGTPHVLINCIAFENGAHGFTDNNNPTAVSLTNCTSFNNSRYESKKSNFQMNRENGGINANLLSFTTDSMGSDAFIGTIDHSVYYNNKPAYYSVVDKTAIAKGDKLGTIVTVASSDFVSLTAPDTTTDFHKVWRDENGNIDTKGFLKLADSSAYATMASDGQALGARLSGDEYMNVVPDSGNDDTTGGDDTTGDDNTGSDNTGDSTVGTIGGTDTALNVSDLTAGDITTNMTVGEFVLNGASSKLTVDANSKSIDGFDFTQRLKTNGKGSITKRSVQYTATDAATLIVYAQSSSSSSDRALVLADASGNVIGTQTALGASISKLTYEIPAAGTYYLYSADSGINMYYFAVDYPEVEVEEPKPELPTVDAIESLDGMVDVWDFGAEVIDTGMHNNLLTVADINSWYADTVVPGSSGVQPLGETFYDDGLIVCMGGKVNNRIRTTNTAISRHDEKTKVLDGVTYTGYFYSNSSKTDSVYVGVEAKAGDILTFVVSSNGGNSTINFQNIETGEIIASDVYEASAQAKIMTFFVPEDGSYKIYSVDEKLVVCRVYRQPTQKVNVVGYVDAPAELTNEYSVTFTNLATGVVTEAIVNNGTYAAVLNEVYSYEVALKNADGYVVISDDVFKLRRGDGGENNYKQFDVTVGAVSLANVTGTLKGIDAATAANLSIALKADQIYVPAVTIDGTSWSAKLETGIEYAVELSGINDYELITPSKIMVTEESTVDIEIAKKPVYAVTLDLVGATAADLANATFTFTNLDEEGYVYTFTGTEGIELRDGVYSVKVTNSGAFEQRLTSNLKVYGKAVTKTIKFNSEVTEWFFTSDDYTGQTSYNGLEITGGKKHGAQYGMAIKSGSIIVPVSGACEVKVSVGYNWDISFDEGTVSYFDNTNSGDIDVSYTYTGNAGTVVINAGDQCTSYIKKIVVIAAAEYKEVVTVGASGCDYTTINDALDAVRAMTRTADQRVTIEIQPGNYEEMLVIDTPNVTLKNASKTPSIDTKNKGVDIDANAVRITSYYGHGYTYYSMGPDCKYDEEVLEVSKENGYPLFENPGTGTTSGSYWNATVVVYESGFQAEGIIFENSFNQYVSEKAANDVIVAQTSAREGSVKRADMKAGDTTVQNKAYVERAAALAIANNVSKVSFDNCKFIGRQDTLFGGVGTTAAFYDCAVYGGTDYIFGGMTAVFAKCDLVFNTSEDKNDVGYITAAQTQSGRGLLMYNCTVTSTIPGVDTASAYTSKAGYFGRPWQANTGEAVFYNTVIDALDAHWSESNASLINPVGWTNSLSGESVMSAEYGTYEMAAGVDNQSARASWATTVTEPVLADGTTISVEAFLGDWDAFAGKNMEIVLPDGKVDNTPSDDPSDEPSGDAPATGTPVKYVFDATTLTASADKEAVAAGTTFADGYFKAEGTVTMRTNSDGTVKSVELGKNATGALQFTVNGVADVTIAMSSTGGSNTSAAALIDADGNVVANNEGITEVSTTAATTMTYTGLAAGTYKVVSPESTYNRGARLYSVVVEDAPLVVTEEYVFDATTLTALADKEAVAAGTAFADGYFKTEGTITKRTNSDGTVKSVELGKNATGALQFTVTGTADVTIAMSSTGGSNTSAAALIDADGNVVANNECITEVSTTAATTMTYTGLAEGTYKVVSPESTYNRGARLYSVVVEQTSSGSRPARADWANVAAPVITEVALDTENANKINVSVNVFIGYDGADSVAVAMKDAEGNVVDTQNYASDATEVTLTFAPANSGTYTFEATASRINETDKAATETKTIDFVLPLTIPNIKGAYNVGNGNVEVEWDAVKEAEKYVVTVEGTNISMETTGLKVTVEGLEIGKTYTIKLEAVRGNDAASATVEKTVEASAEVKWYFSAYGSSTNTSSNGYEELEDGSVRVYSTGNKGKIVPGSTDGLAFYYTEIDPATTNFTLTATAKVNEWTLSNGQEGFGIMAADRVGKHGDGTMFWNNAYMAIASKVEYYYDVETGAITDDSTKAKISMKLGVGAQEKVGVTADNLADFNANKTEVINENFVSTTTALESSCGVNGAGTYNIVGNYKGTEPTGTVENPITEFKFTIQKNNTGYFVSYTDLEGNTVTKKYYDTEALSQLDKDSVYLGFFASRNADITFTDIEFTTIAPEDDAPAEGREITYVTPNFQITSASVANSAAYDLTFVGNADGTLVIKDAKGADVINQTVKANEKVAKVVELALGNNKFDVTFTPDKNYKPSEFEEMLSYEAVSFEHTVIFKSYGEVGQALYVSPNGAATGNGTKANPLDVYTAVKYVQPGQTIVIMEGTYNLSSTIKVERGIDGTAENMIYMVADPEASTRPVFDFGGRCAGMVIAGDYWYFKGFDVTRSADAQKGMQISGNYNIVDQVNAYKNGNTGIQISRYLGTDTYEDWPANNWILNCTSYLNADKGYEDADGFAAKLTVGDGNVFNGCIAHHNADDGWDLFAKVQSGSIGNVIIKNCVAYKNGYVLDENGNEINAGNGNGFKMGGDSMPGQHALENCIAFFNKAKGLDSNSGPDIQLYNCVSFDNESYNVALYTNTAANTAYYAHGVISYRKNVGLNVSETFKLKGTQDKSDVQNAKNFYWDVDSKSSVNTEGTKVADDWFESLEFTGITRNADGTINMNGFLMLTDKAAAGEAIGGVPSNDVMIGEETDGTIAGGTITPVQPSEPSKPSKPSTGGSSSSKPSSSSSATVIPSTGNSTVIEDGIVPLAPIVDSFNGLPIEEIAFKNGDAVLKAAVLQKYFGRNISLLAHLGNGIGFTINTIDITAQMADLNLGYVKEELKSFANDFYTWNLTPSTETVLSMEVGLHVHLGYGYVGKPAYIYVKNVYTGSFELYRTCTVNEIGNVGLFTNQLTDVMVLVQK